MVRRDEGELIAYLAENPSWTRLVLSDAPDPDAARLALRAAAKAVWRIPHPGEPSEGLPNYCGVTIEDGQLVLCLDVKDRSDDAERIVAAIVGALEAAGVGGRLDPLPYPQEWRPPQRVVERPEPRTIGSLIGRILHEPGHPLLALRGAPEGVPAAEMAAFPMLAWEDGRVIQLITEPDDAGMVRLTDAGQRVVDEFMRERAARLAPLLEGVDADLLHTVRDSCLALAGVPLEGLRQFIGSDELLALETFHALDVARLGAMMPKRLWFDERRLAMLRLHRLGKAGMAESECGSDSDWLDEGQRAGALTRESGIVRLTERGHQVAADYLARLGGEPEIYDACWSIVQNYRRASP